MKKSLALILVLMMVLSVAGVVFAKGPPAFQATINITGDLEVVVGGSTTLTANWSTNDQDVTNESWSVDGTVKELAVIPVGGRTSGTSTFEFDADGLNPGVYQVCFRIWHHTQTQRDATKCVTVTVIVPVETYAVLYLHNKPTPPTGDTIAQAPLPMNGTPPTATTLYNYDVNFNPMPGREIKKDSNGATTSDLTKYQTWAHTLTTTTGIDGDVVLTFWARHKNDIKWIKFQAQLYDGDTSFATAYVAQVFYNKLNTIFTQVTITFSGVNKIINAGNVLTLRIYNLDTGDEPSAADGNIAYDTIAYPSNLHIPLN